MNMSEAAEYLGVGRTTLQRWRRVVGLPVGRRVKGALLFTVEELDEAELIVTARPGRALASARIAAERQATALAAADVDAEALRAPVDSEPWSLGAANARAFPCDCRWCRSSREMSAQLFAELESRTAAAAEHPNRGKFWVLTRPDGCRIVDVPGDWATTPVEAMLKVYDGAYEAWEAAKAGVCVDLLDRSAWESYAPCYRGTCEHEASPHKPRCGCAGCTAAGVRAAALADELDKLAGAE